MNKLMMFEGNNVEIIRGENGEPLFELYSTGMALGQIVMAKGTTYANKKKNRKKYLQRRYRASFTQRKTLFNRRNAI